MKQAARESLDAYYREADSWADDRQDMLRASRRTAWIVASVAVVIALFEAIALIVLMPMKTVVPYTLLVDKQTGYVQDLKPLDAEKIAPDTALTQSFLVQYVIARESYDAGGLQASYRKVQLWSAESAKADYVNAMQPANPASPLNRYPRNSIVDTRVKSISSLGGNSALVRFDTVRRDQGGQAQPAESWVAVIKYRFSTGPMRAEDRFVNPLGFQVFGYRRDQENLTPDAAPAATGTAPQAASGQPQILAPGVQPTPNPTATSPSRLPSGVEVTL
jgi:type IV secretion system protein VirB8